MNLNVKRYQAFFFLLLIGYISCEKDAEATCLECTAAQTTPFEVCQNSDGNAEVNGQDTATNFEDYISNLEASGASCGN